MNGMELLSTINRGGFPEHFNQVLEEVVAGVFDCEEAGEITIKIKVAPAKKGAHVNASYKIDAKVPHDRVGASAFYATPEGSLERDDPNQPSMFEGIEGGRGAAV